MSIILLRVILTCIILLIVILPSVAIQNLILLSIILPTVVLKNVTPLSSALLGVVLLNVVAPLKPYYFFQEWRTARRRRRRRRDLSRDAPTTPRKKTERHTSTTVTRRTTKVTTVTPTMTRSVTCDASWCPSRPTTSKSFSSRRTRPRSRTRSQSYFLNSTLIGAEVIDRWTFDRLTGNIWLTYASQMTTRERHVWSTALWLGTYKSLLIATQSVEFLELSRSASRYFLTALGAEL